MTATDSVSPAPTCIALTMGDPAGIGPEIVLKAFRDASSLLKGCFVAGDLSVMRQASCCLAGPGEPPLPVVALNHPEECLDVPPRCVPVLQIVTPAHEPLPLGSVSAEAGRMAGEAVTWAARAALRGDVAALVTAPLHKEALSAAGYRHPGHTELLQEEAARHAGVSIDALPVRMMLANQELRTVLVSIHVALREAIERLTTAGIVESLHITHQALGRMLRRPPRIAVAGLNPHAGEGGLFGREELEVIAPAVALARQEGIDASGPWAPDTVFMRARARHGEFREFDVVLAMYHDQGLIPVKYLGVEEGVNVTLGLPFVRTSPDHGTAFDIAGRGVADPASMLAAIRMARQLIG